MSTRYSRVSSNPHPSPRMDADAGEELGAGEADGQDIGVGVSDRWRLGENE